MRKIAAIIWKDTLIRFSSLSELLFFLILPVGFTFLLAGGAPAGSSDGRVRLLVVNQANTPLAEQVIAGLEQSEAVRPEVASLQEAEEAFTSRSVAALLVIPAGFSLDNPETELAALELRQQPNNLNAQVAQRAVLAAIRRAGSAVTIARNATAEAERLQPFASQAERGAYFDAALAQAQTLLDSAPDRVRVVRASTRDPAANSSAGQMITWVFIPLLGISGLFAYERSEGTLRRLLVTPTARATYLLGTLSGQVLAALVQMALLVLFGVFVMKLNWASEPLALAVLLVAFALASAALGTTLGTFIKSAGQANGLSIMLGMTMALMGGCWYPIELFPDFVRTAVKALPTTWAMQGMLDLALRGQGLDGVLLEAGVLLGFAAVFFAIGAWRFRYE